MLSKSRKRRPGERQRCDSCTRHGPPIAIPMAPPVSLVQRVALRSPFPWRRPFLLYGERPSDRHSPSAARGPLGGPAEDAARGAARRTAKPSASRALWCSLLLLLLILQPRMPAPGGIDTLAVSAGDETWLRACHHAPQKPFGEVFLDVGNGRIIETVPGSRHHALSGGHRVAHLYWPSLEISSSMLSWIFTMASAIWSMSVSGPRRTSTPEMPMASCS
jgi:hypothetical protein